MVMPCSRSARRPSTSSDRSGLEAALLRGPLDGLELVGEHRLGVVQQPADQGGLAVVDGAGAWRTGARSCGHQKYPSRLRSSMAASESRSSARVAPRSVIREAVTSAMTPATSVASDSTAPVQDMSPTVR